MRKPDYKRDGVRLYCGDALEVLPEIIADFHATITDPPYGIAHKSHGQRFVRAKPIAGDECGDLACAAAEIVETKPLAMFYSP